jgi:CheY-like chemotaxis protein
MNILRPHILLIDDDQEVLQMLTLFLNMFEVNIFPFSDPVAALSFFSQQPTTFDCIICDLVMSPRDGLEILNDIRKMSKNVHFYLMSANASEESIALAKSYGVSGYVEKPLVHLKLEEIVQGLLSK